MAEHEAVKSGDTLVVEKEHLQQVLDVLHKGGFTTVGPVVRDGAVSYEPVTSVSEFPAGWTDEQTPGHYRLKKEESGTLFDYLVAAQSWMRWLFPPERPMFKAVKNAKGVEVIADQKEPGKSALIGVRPCELAAIQVQDRVFMCDRYTDPIYAARRRDSFIVAVNCGRAGGTCFCASMKTGPRAESGFDLSLTEIIESGRIYYVLEVGTDEGAVVMAQVKHSPAGGADKTAASRTVAMAADNMKCRLDTTGIKELLYRNYDNPEWEKVGARCLACTNCTMVCPTCFCTTVEDRTSLGGDTAERVSQWDSCYTLDYTRVAGGIMRQSSGSRYRQWLVHKMASWIDQFGSSGCVGCGRCITWCPVGIDVTEEVAAIRASDGAGKAKE